MARLSSRNGARAREAARLKDALAEDERRRALAEGRLFGRRKPKRTSRKAQALAPKIYPPAEIRPLIIRHKRLGVFFSKQPLNIFRKQKT